VKYLLTPLLILLSHTLLNAQFRGSNRNFLISPSKMTFDSLSYQYLPEIIVTENKEATINMNKSRSGKLKERMKEELKEFLMVELKQTKTAKKND
jgi:hypothetical protein